MNEVFDSRLKLLDEAQNFTNWIYSQYKPYIQGNILELSSGIGTYSSKLVKDFQKNEITLTEFLEDYVEKLRDRFQNDNVRCLKLDMNDSIDYEKLGYDNFDTIICSNVLEHIEKDEFAFKQCNKLLKKNGKLLLIVPQNPDLYSLQDKELGHFRRYTKDEIMTKAKDANFKILKIRNFNAVGVLGWKLNKRSNRSKNPATLMKLFNILIPIVKLFDDIITSKLIGLSFFVVLKKHLN